MAIRVKHAICAFLAIFTIAVAVGMLPAAAHADAAADASSVQLTTQAVTAKSRLSNYAYYDVCQFEYLNSAKTEGIGVTGEYDRDGYIDDWTVWYVKGSSVEPIYSVNDAPSTMHLWAKGTKLWTVDGGKIFKVEQAYVSTTVSYAFFISRDGKVKMLPQVGGSMTRTGKNEFSIVRDNYDTARSSGMWTGHNYNAYYYRWTGKKLVELGGKELTIWQFKRAKNGNKVLDSIKKKVQKDRGVVPSIDRIFYRSNGIVNVNYSYSYYGSNYYYNVKLKLSSGALRYVKAHSYGGATSLDRAIEGGRFKKRGGSESGKVGVSWPTSIPKAFKKKG